jgi:hypothetical protein
MKTLKLFLLSIMWGHPVSFLADLIRIRLAKSLVKWPEEKDLMFLTDDYESWDPRLEEMEFDEPESYGRRPGAYIH